MYLLLVYLLLVSAAFKFCTQRAALRIGVLGLLAAFQGLSKLLFISKALQPLSQDKTNSPMAWQERDVEEVSYVWFSRWFYHLGSKGHIAVCPPALEELMQKHVPRATVHGQKKPKMSDMSLGFPCRGNVAPRGKVRGSQKHPQ